MTDFNHILQQGTVHAWLFIPTAILLGVLHGLEPGHSKTMMAAFIIAVRGTILQAVLLGLSAAFSHTLIIWVLAAAALKYGGQWRVETTEPYFQLASAVLIIGLALWMIWRTKREADAEAAHKGAQKRLGPQGGPLIDTGHGLVELSVFEDGVPPVFRLYFYQGSLVPDRLPSPGVLAIETIRPDGQRQTFSFFEGKGFLQSNEEIPEPHAFTAVFSIQHHDHAHRYQTEFSEEGHHHHHGHDHTHTHTHEHRHGLDGDSGEYQDAHELMHAQEIQEKFANRSVTTGQVILFGLTGGLMPCPAALSILVICLQLKKVTLGLSLVLAFSFGLAITLVSVGVLAAWSLHHAVKRFSGFSDHVRKLPYLSGALLIFIGSILACQAWSHLR